MEWLDKIPKWIQIPLKILLPALCIFSGFLLLISDNLAEKLYLKEFRQQSGFAFGLIFTITLTLILVYIIFFASKPAIEKYRVKWAKRKFRKQIEELKQNEKMYVFALYNISNHAYTFPMNDPTINLLHRRGYVYTFKQEADMLTYGSLGIIYGLQPTVVEAVADILDKKVKEIGKLNRKLEKLKDEKKREKVQSLLEYEEKIFKNLTSLSLEKYFKGAKVWID